VAPVGTQTHAYGDSVLPFPYKIHSPCGYVIVRCAGAATAAGKAEGSEWVEMGRDMAHPAIGTISSRPRSARRFAIFVVSSNRAASRGRLLCWAAMTVDADPIAPEIADRIRNDAWARTLGIEFVDIRRGYCRLRLPLQPHMVNFQGFPHGGVIFSVADVAFGAACNSHGEAAVALSVTIDYLAAVTAEVTLVAEAREVKQGRRAGFYEVSVATADGRAVAAAHCVAHRVTS
jgi:acyl-CoA thioesterase